jgi:hypothetical protein
MKTNHTTPTDADIAAIWSRGDRRYSDAPLRGPRPPMLIASTTVVDGAMSVRTYIRHDDSTFMVLWYADVDGMCIDVQPVVVD